MSQDGKHEVSVDLDAQVPAYDNVELPSRDIITQEFYIWMVGVIQQISIRRRNWWYARVLDTVNLEQCMEPDHFCIYFTTKQMNMN